MNKLCVNYDSEGYIHVTGTPDTTEDCPYIITESGNQVIELYPFNLTVEEGFMISGAILMVWAAAYGFKLLRRSLDNT
jgi:hypothetical protein